MKIYTRTGDKGQTSLFGGKRVAKDSLRVEAYGTVDELNSAIGVGVGESFHPKDQLLIKNVVNELTKIQHDLFSIGSYLASPVINRELRIKNIKTRVTGFEKLIDTMTEELPTLRDFILPGGGEGGSHLHFARTVCRRAERRIVGLSKNEHVAGDVLVYLNRLSDLLFTMARYVNMREKKTETIWKKP